MFLLKDASCSFRQSVVRLAVFVLNQEAFMEYQVGEKVFHPMHGVGEIAAIEGIRFEGVPTRPYYKVVFSTINLWVEEESTRVGRLRPITPRVDFARYLALLASQPQPLDNNFRNRQNDLVNRMKSGTFESICEIVRDLNARRSIKKLSEFDGTLLKKASGFLFEEWAEVNDVTRAEAESNVESLLKEGISNQ
jgi:CarD family transcriptional regulator